MPGARGHKRRKGCVGESHGRKGLKRPGCCWMWRGEQRRQPLPTHATAPSQWASPRTGLKRERCGQLPPGEEQPPEGTESCCPTMDRLCCCKIGSSCPG